MVHIQVVLKDEPDIDPNDHSSILEHLDKVVCIFFPFYPLYLLRI